MPGQSVRITWRFAAQPEAVWRAWTDADRVKRWFGSDPGGVVLSAAVDVRVGGTFEVTFANSDGTRHTCRGTYQEVEPLGKLAFSWTWKDRPLIAESVSVRLRPAENGTLMDFEHADIDAGTTHDYRVGWRTTFEKLDRTLAADP